MQRQLVGPYESPRERAARVWADKASSARLRSMQRCARSVVFCGPESKPGASLWLTLGTFALLTGCSGEPLNGRPTASGSPSLLTGCTGEPLGGPPTASGSAPPGPVDEADCNKRLLQMTHIMSGKYDTSCRTPSDCVLGWPSTDCARACPLAVSRAAASAYDAAAEEANRGPCKGFKEAGCVTAEPSCVVKDPVCEKGRCKIPGG